MLHTQRQASYKAFSANDFVSSETTIFSHAITFTV
jgi:hypothetical protein